MRFVQVAVLLLFPSFLSAQVEYVQVRVSAANVRQGPSTDDEIIAVLHEGDIRDVAGDVPYWYEIVLNAGRHGFIAKRLCTVVIDTSEIEEFDEELAEPLDDLYEIPAQGTMVTLPGCTSSSLSVDFNVCAQEGSGGLNALANVLKNRVDVPCTFEMVTIDDLLSLNNLPRNVRSLDVGDPRLEYLQTLEGRAVRLDGFLAMVKRAGRETANCNSSSRRDLHVDIIGDDSDDPKDNRGEIVATEVTPWFSEHIPT